MTLGKKLLPALNMSEQGLSSQIWKANTNGKIVERASPSCFQKLVEEHYKPAYRFAYSLCGNHHDACDVTQQAFYYAQTKLHQLRDATKMKQWLFSILYREFLSIRRRDTTHPQTSLEFSESELPHISVDHAMSLDGKTILIVLQALHEHFRAPIVLFYLKQLSYKEIALTLDVPIGTVMSRLARGKEILRQQLEKARIGPIRNTIPLQRPELEGVSDG